MMDFAVSFLKGFADVLPIDQSKAWQKDVNGLEVSRPPRR